jgi:tRNA A37 N6-isopentenylltransferase MiaA
VSWTVEITLWCEGEGCAHWEQFCENGVQATRKTARRQGWTRRAGKDLCKPCSTGLESDRTEQNIANRTDLGGRIS